MIEATSSLCSTRVARSALLPIQVVRRIGEGMCQPDDRSERGSDFVTHAGNEAILVCQKLILLVGELFFLPPMEVYFCSGAHLQPQGGDCGNGDDDR